MYFIRRWMMNSKFYSINLWLFKPEPSEWKQKKFFLVVFHKLDLCHCIMCDAKFEWDEGF